MRVLAAARALICGLQGKSFVHGVAFPRGPLGENRGDHLQGAGGANAIGGFQSLELSDDGHESAHA
ncbi:MAG: hypothetical protein ABIP11_04530 [Luteimonas sp.]